jgi:toxin ParE1/3/4
VKVVLSSKAQGDLEAIADHIAADNPGRARSFVRELVAKARAIGGVPHEFPLLETRLKAGIRRRAHGNYLIFYRVDPTQVYVLRVLHGARDYEGLLGPDE